MSKRSKSPKDLTIKFRILSDQTERDQLDPFIIRFNLLLFLVVDLFDLQNSTYFLFCQEDKPLAKDTKSIVVM